MVENKEHKCAKCGEIFEKEELDGSNYCKECRARYNKEYRNINKGSYIYLFVDKELEVLYCGSCSTLGTRISQHLNGYSHLKRNLIDWKLLGLQNVEYAILDVKTKEERLFIEQYLITKFKPLLNDYMPINKISEERALELQKQADELVFKLLESKLLDNIK